MQVIIKQWNKYLANNLYNNWYINKFVDENGFSLKNIEYDCDKDYIEIKDYLLKSFNDIQGQTSLNDYKQDLLFGIELYKLFSPNTQNDFFLCNSQNNYFWAYINMRVIPNIIQKRWEKQNNLAGKMYSEPKRNWTMQLWWYIHLSLLENDDNLDKTKEMLLKPNFNRDTIVQLCDRTGDKGIIIDLYRKIIKKYSEYTPEDIKQMNISYEDFFRKIMKVQTSKMPLYEPCFYKNGLDGYVDHLFAIVENSQKDY